MTGRGSQWFLVFVLIARVTADLNVCCPNGVPISKDLRCGNTSVEINLTCKDDEDIYMLDEIETLRPYTVNTSTGNFILEDVEFAPAKYCTNKMVIGDISHNIILVCLVSEDTPSILPIIIFGALELLTIAFLFIIIIIYVALPELRDLQGKCILHFLISYCVLFIINILHYHNGLSCVIKAYSFYYFSFCTWCWICVSSFNIWKASIVKNTEDSRTYVTYLLYGYGFPTLMLVLMLLIQTIPGDHLKPNFRNLNCWFRDSVARWWYYHLPIAVLLLANALLLAIARRCLRRTHYSRINIHRAKALRARCWLYSKLSLIVSLTWIFEIVCKEIFPQFNVLIFAIDILNCLQGFLIFITLIAFRNKVLKVIAKQKPCGMNCFPTSWMTVVDAESEEENRNRYLSITESELIEIPLRSLNSNI